MQRDVNTGSIVSVARCQQQPFYPHVHFHFIMCSAVDAFLASPSNKVCVDSGRADTWETDPRVPRAGRGFVFGLQHKAFLHLMCTCAKLRVMKRYYARGEWSNLYVELLLQPVGLWEACSVGTPDDNKAKYSSRKNCMQVAGEEKVHCELSGLFFIMPPVPNNVRFSLTDFGPDTLSHLVPQILCWCLSYDCA